MSMGPFLLRDTVRQRLEQDVEDRAVALQDEATRTEYARSGHTVLIPYRDRQ